MLDNGTPGTNADADPRRIVAEGYDRIAERYATWSVRDVVDQVRQRYVDLLLGRLADGAAVLELGCGGGGPTTRELAARFALTGVDISGRQVELARMNVPRGTFMQADMTRLRLPPASFDGVAAFYSLTHLPHGELPRMIEKIAAWLRPGGVFVGTMSARGGGGSVEPDWLGAPMYFSGYSVEENQRFLDAAGLLTVSAQVETIYEEGDPVAFLWVVAEKPG